MVFIEINGISNCKWCNLAVKLCKDSKILYKYKIHPKSSFISTVSKERGVKITKAPQIFLNINDNYTHIGGFTDFKNWIEDEFIGTD